MYVLINIHELIESNDRFRADLVLRDIARTG
jgi:hypothetical protein